MRLSIDSLHPTAEQLDMAPDGFRWRHALRQDADPKGPILLVGLGRKSARLYGLEPMEWERRMAEKLKGDRKIIWRPKGKSPEPIRGTKMSYGTPIEHALRGCSLVVCRHSNVAVDACIAGVPVQCEDGAAHALYSKGPSPSREDRAEFLRRLGWWNWKFSEAPQAWEWIQGAVA